MRRRLGARRCWFLVVGLAACASLQAAEDAPLKLDTGLITGTRTEDDAVRVYRGIPFAAPPVGPLRWQPPQAPAKWEGVRACDAFSATCPQTPYASGSLYFQRRSPPAKTACI